jgi:hypothetical protein
MEILSISSTGGWADGNSETVSTKEATDYILQLQMQFVANVGGLKTHSKQAKTAGIFRV